MQRSLTKDVYKRQGQGVFVNSGVFHAVEQAETGDALLHSGVFHPRLIGGMDTIFWQKLVHPLLQPGAPAFFLLDEMCIRDRIDAIAVFQHSVIMIGQRGLEHRADADGASGGGTHPHHVVVAPLDVHVVVCLLYTSRSRLCGRLPRLGRLCGKGVHRPVAGARSPLPRHLPRLLGA